MWKQHKLKIIIGAAIVLLVVAMAAAAFLPKTAGDAQQPMLQSEPTEQAQPSQPTEASEDSHAPTSPSEQTAPPAAPTTVDIPSPPVPEASDEQAQPATKPTEPPAPKPTEPATEPTEPPAPATCTISISCVNALNSSDLPASVRSVLPESGWLLGSTTVELQEGDTAFSVLQRVTAAYGIQMESSWTPVYNSAYVEGIGNLYEFDCGETSGWMYSVDGQFSSYGSSSSVLQDGAVVQWAYTCSFGADLSAAVG